MKVKFIKKPLYEELIPQNEFVIEKEIMLTNEEFNKFIHKPCDDYSFIEENTGLMYSDKNIFHAILIKCESKDYGILIESEGFSYGRYCAYIPLTLLKKTKKTNVL